MQFQINPVQYHVVFSVLEATEPWQVRVTLPLILACGTVGAAIAFLRQRKRWMLLVIGFGILLGLATYVNPGPGVQGMYENARAAYRNGEYATVEGRVSNFHPMPASGHPDESFTVNGVQFSYSDYVVVPCFNHTASHGGPMREGLQVRIAYSGNCIFKLEIAATQ